MYDYILEFIIDHAQYVIHQLSYKVVIIISFFDFDEIIDNILPDTLEVHVAANLSEGLCTLLRSAHWAAQSLVIATAPATNVQVLAT